MNQILLQNDSISVALSAHGEIKSIKSFKTGDECRFTENKIALLTDYGELSFTPEQHKETIQDGQTVVFNYSCDYCDYSVQFVLTPDRSYFQRVVRVVPFHEMTIYRLENDVMLEDPEDEIVDYQTFWNCPTVLFLRKGSRGIFTGFANPFFELRNKGKLLDVFFEPSLILQAGESYQSDANFWGMYPLSGIKIHQQIPKSTIRYNGVNHTRYRNPSGYIPLDRNEIRSFKQFAEDYLELRVTDFKLIFYNFFIPLPPAQTLFPL